MYNREQLFTISKPKWEWQKVDSELKTKLFGKMASINLKPQIVFQDRNSQSEAVRLRFKVSVDTEKSLQYQNEVGWNWHKSSNLPAISLKVELRHPQTNSLCPLPENLQARMFATKIIVNSLQRQVISHIDDVGLRGPCQVDLKDGCGVFNGIRFQTTSYNNQGVKFHLLIVLFLSQQGQFDPSNIICSTMSPPIFVDSRKSARDYQQKRFLSFVQIFDPYLMKKQFSKKSIKQKNVSQMKIQNSMDGLYNYLTAPNIRHKVKHPFFLCIKFSNVFRILVNQRYAQNSINNSSISDIIKNFQRSMVKQIGKNKKYLKSVGKFGKPFLINVYGQCNNLKKNKIYESLQFLSCRAIQFTKYVYQVSHSYKNLCQLGDLIKSYSQCHEQLLDMTNKQIQIRKNKGDFVGDQLSQKDEQIHLTKNNKDSIHERQRHFIQFQDEIQQYQMNENQKQQNEAYQRHITQNNRPHGIKQEHIEKNQRIDNFYLRTKSSSDNIGNISQLKDVNNKNPLLYNLIQCSVGQKGSQIDYCQNLIYQIDFQNSMLQDTIRQNLAVRQRLIGLMSLGFANEIKNKYNFNCQQNFPEIQIGNFIDQIRYQNSLIHSGQLMSLNFKQLTQVKQKCSSRIQDKNTIIKSNQTQQFKVEHFY